MLKVSGLSGATAMLPAGRVRGSRPANATTQSQSLVATTARELPRSARNARSRQDIITLMSNSIYYSLIVLIIASRIVTPSMVSGPPGPGGPSAASAAAPAK